MTRHRTLEAQRRYYRDNYQTDSIHRPEQRVIPPENIERREFTVPCWRCNARGECQHRRSYGYSAPAY
jgi:hypothetical protein